MSSRINAIKKEMINYNVEAFLISNFYNILYLTNFKTLTTNEREAFVLITKNDIYLFTDSRYPFEKKLVDYKVKLLEPDKGLFYHLQEIINKEKIRSIGIEGDDLHVKENIALNNFFPQIKFVSTDKLVIKIREKKSQEEILKIEKACAAADNCLKEIIPIIKIGTTEKEIAFNLEFWLKKNLGDIAFDPIVAVDENSSIPHYNTKIGKNNSVKDCSVILIDFGAKYENYLSDITRMIFINPDQEKKNIYDKLSKIQNGIIKYIDLDKSPIQIDTFCREELKKNLLPNFSHSVGHGVGLEIHEYPKISQTSTDLIANNQVFTIEPGVYFENKWGMRIEDTVVIKNGKTETLTKYPKELLIIKS